MAHPRSYSDLDLAHAIHRSTSWRGTLRRLGLTATSASAIRSVRARAESLAIDYQHFSGQSRWDEEQLRRAIEASNSWEEVAATLKLNSTSASRLRGHAARLEIDAAHLNAQVESSAGESFTPDVKNLNRAGPLLAAAWFTICGHDVSWPLEPSRYDLIVRIADEMRRIQVKTTRVRAGNTWIIYLSTSGKSRKTYSPEEIDEFFLIDGDLNYYLVPVTKVGGLQAIHLNKYSDYRLLPLCPQEQRGFASAAKG